MQYYINLGCIVVYNCMGTSHSLSQSFRFFLYNVFDWLRQDFGHRLFCWFTCCSWKPGDSHFWAGLMATKKHFFGYGKFSIKDESEVRF
jgi:hypothetical protein